MNMDRTIRKNSATAILLLGVVVFGAGWMQKQKEKRPMLEPLLSGLICLIRVSLRPIFSQLG
jgi:hypothetical protein